MERCDRAIDFYRADSSAVVEDAATGSGGSARPGWQGGSRQGPGRTAVESRACLPPYELYGEGREGNSSRHGDASQHSERWLMSRASSTTARLQEAGLAEQPQSSSPWPTSTPPRKAVAVLSLPHPLARFSLSARNVAPAIHIKPFQSVHRHCRFISTGAEFAVDIGHRQITSTSALESGVVEGKKRVRGVLEICHALRRQR